MEPCLFRHGKYSPDKTGKEVTHASMEPCLFRHGKPGIDLKVRIAVVASMEPCLFRHGKRRPCFTNYPVVLGLQWSHVFSDMVR